MEDMIQPLEQTLVFDMIISIGNELIPCDVYFARLSQDITFTRVIIYPGNKPSERIIDVDRDEEGWIDMYTGEPSAWSQLVAPSLDFHIAQNKQD
jgi:hypothetical protein